MTLSSISKKYSVTQLESACQYALTQNIKHYEYIEIIIKQQLSSLATDKPPVSGIPLHDNIRGPEYYH